MLRLHASELAGSRFAEAATAAVLRGRTANIGATLSGGLFIFLISDRDNNIARGARPAATAAGPCSTN